MQIVVCCLFIFLSSFLATDVEKCGRIYLCMSLEDRDEFIAVLMILIITESKLRQVS